MECEVNVSTCLKIFSRPIILKIYQRSRFLWILDFLLIIIIIIITRGGSRGWAQGARVPPYFETKLRPRRPEKNFFGDCPPPPPPLSLRVRCLPLPPLPSPRVPVNMWSEFILEYRNVVYLYYCNLKFLIQLVKDTLWQVKNIVSTMKLKTTVKVIFC